MEMVQASGTIKTPETLNPYFEQWLEACGGGLSREGVIAGEDALNIVCESITTSTSWRGTGW